MSYRSPDLASHRCPSSALAVAEKVFSLLQRGPAPLSLAAHDLRGDIPASELPGGGGVWGGDAPVSLWSLRELVVRRELPVAVVNRMWMLLVSGAASRGESATVGAVGMALPALCALARELSGSRRGDCVDLDAEILSGFLSSLAAARPCSGGLFPSLLRHARAAGLAWVTAQRVAARDVPLEPALLGHLTAPEDPRDVDPGQVLTELVDLRVITERDAELISATRLEGIPAREVAAAAKLPYDTLRKRRLRAECRVAAYLGGRPAHEPSDPRPPECCRARDGRRGFGSRSGRDGPAGPNGHGGRASCRTRSRGMTR